MEEVLENVSWCVDLVTQNGARILFVEFETESVHQIDEFREEDSRVENDFYFETLRRNVGYDFLEELRVKF